MVKQFSLIWLSVLIASLISTTSLSISPLSPSIRVQSSIFKHKSQSIFNEPDILSFSIQCERQCEQNPIYSDIISSMGSKWQLIYFPNGIDNTSNHISIYLSLIGENNKRDLTFKVGVRSIDDGSILAERISRPHRFSKVNESWGFSKFCSSNLIENNNEIKVEVQILQSKYHLPQHGLLNLGNTCYMNSVLQTLFYVDKFRERVLTSLNNPVGPISYEFAKLYSELINEDNENGILSPIQFAQRMNIFPPYYQEDAQEFKSNILYSLDDEEQEHNGKIEHQNKNIPSSPSSSQMFRGMLINTIDCVDIEYKKSWEEPFLELVLDVKKPHVRPQFDGDLSTNDFSHSDKNLLKNTNEQHVESQVYSIQKSLDEYFTNEFLSHENDNAYLVKGKGKQNAVKRIQIKEAPEVLHVQLKRFSYSKGRFLKISDVIKLDQEIDLTSYLKKSGNDKGEDEESSSGGGSEDCVNDRVVYKLHSVIIHTGASLDSGHYYAFVKTNMNQQTRLEEKREQEEGEEQGRWVLFDDTRVRSVGWERVARDAEGSSTSAYLLQYLRVS